MSVITKRQLTKSCGLLVLSLVLLNGSASAQECLNEFLPGHPFPNVVIVDPNVPTNPSIESISEEVLHNFGLARRITVFVGVPVDNACAAISRDGLNNRLIYVNADWLEKVTSGEYWSKVGIIAHEIGHHVNYHIHNGDLNKWQRELEADTFAGRAVASMGGSIDDALKMLTALDERGTASHPDKQYRVAAITSGFEVNRTSNEPPPPPASVFSFGGTVIGSEMLANQSDDVNIFNTKASLTLNKVVAARPKLVLDEAELDLSGPFFDGKILIFSKIEAKKSRILVGRNKLTILTASFLADDTIVSSRKETDSGSWSEVQPQLTLIVSKSFEVEKFLVDLSGRPGLNGPDGLIGEEGNGGAAGNPGAFSTVRVPKFNGLKVKMGESRVCLAAPSNGLPGAPGRQGAAGGDGGPGESGGDFSLLLMGDTQTSVSLTQREFVVNVNGGPGGKGGAGGPGGDGGPGGKAGVAVGPCPPATDGVAGQDGPVGPAGSVGARGQNGQYVTRAVTPLEVFTMRTQNKNASFK